MSGHNIIVVGASAGGIEALTQLVSRLPSDLPAAVFVVVHIPAHATSVLPRIFSRSGPLTAMHPSEHEPIRPGRIYVAPPDRHMLIKRGRVVLTRGPRENGHRPAVDPLFNSAAVAYGPRVVGVILSGSLDDGSAGLAAVKARGGVTVAQSPEEALYPSMPRHAIEAAAPDHVLPIAGIAALVAALAADGASGPKEGDMGDDLEAEVKISELEPDALHGTDHPGTPSGFACPDCGGSLWELSGAELIRFRCRVGHAWSADSLLAEQADGLERALWTALRALEERVTLCQRLERRFAAAGNAYSAARMHEQGGECVRSAEVLRTLLVSGRPALFDEPPTAPNVPAASGQEPSHA